MRVVSEKRERVMYFPKGHILVCDTVRQLVDDSGNVMMENVVRTEFTGDDWFTGVMAKELYDWQQSGFSGPPPIWTA